MKLLWDKPRGFCFDTPSDRNFDETMRKKKTFGFMPNGLLSFQTSKPSNAPRQKPSGFTPVDRYLQRATASVVVGTDKTPLG